MPRYHLIDGVKVQFTAEEESIRDAEELAFPNELFNRCMSNLRAKRDALLSQSDWEVIKAKETGATLSASFKTYRQALRDITEGLTTVEEVEAVVFPEKP